VSIAVSPVDPTTVIQRAVKTDASALTLNADPVFPAQQLVKFTPLSAAVHPPSNERVPSSPVYADTTVHCETLCCPAGPNAKCTTPPSAMAGQSAPFSHFAQQ